jgi:hypothetical protein
MLTTSDVGSAGERTLAQKQNENERPVILRGTQRTTVGVSKSKRNTPTQMRHITLLSGYVAQYCLRENERGAVRN